jgi:hypothetical protein
MLYVNYRGGVSGYDEGQIPIVHLVSSVERVAESILPFVFTDGHPVKAFSQFFNDIKDLDKIDWDTMKSRYWHDTDDFPDRERRRMAEFLVHKFFPWHLVIEVGVFTATIENEVQRILENSQHKPLVQVRPNWYF